MGIKGINNKLNNDALSWWEQYKKEPVSL